MVKMTSKKLGQKIRVLRITAGLSQEDLANHIGLARQAIGQIEKGERNIDGIELNKIAELLSVSLDSLFKDDPKKKISREQYFFGKKIKSKFDIKKFKNLILYILFRCGGKPNIGETVLYKLLYFADFDFFELYNKPITGMEYIKLQYGPVPLQSIYLPMISDMEARGELKIIKQIYHGMTQKKYIALADVDLSIFSLQEMKSIDSVIDRLSDMTATQIKDYVHGDAPWKIAEPEEIIDYRSVFERSVPYAQKDYSEIMQDASGEDAIKALGSISKEEYDYYMKLK